MQNKNYELRIFTNIRIQSPTKFGGGFRFERVRGIEPLSRSWKDRVMPLYDTRISGYWDFNPESARPFWSGSRDLNPRSHAPKACMLAATPLPDKWGEC